MKRLSSSETLEQPDQVAYDFIDGVRDILLSTVRISETISVLTAVSRFLEIHLAHPLNFSALLADPSVTSDLVIEADSRPFAVVAIHVLQRLGGEYARLAAYLQRALDRTSLSLEPRQVTTQTLEEREQDVASNKVIEREREILDETSQGTSFQQHSRTIPDKLNRILLPDTPRTQRKKQFSAS